MMACYQPLSRGQEICVFCWWFRIQVDLKFQLNVMVVGCCIVYRYFLRYISFCQGVMYTSLTNVFTPLSPLCADCVTTRWVKEFLAGLYFDPESPRLGGSMKRHGIHGFQTLFIYASINQKKIGFSHHLPRNFQRQTAQNPIRTEVRVDFAQSQHFTVACSSSAGMLGLWWTNRRSRTSQELTWEKALRCCWFLWTLFKRRVAVWHLNLNKYEQISNQRTKNDRMTDPPLRWPWTRESPGSFRCEKNMFLCFARKVWWFCCFCWSKFLEIRKMVFRTNVTMSGRYFDVFCWFH